MDATQHAARSTPSPQLLAHRADVRKRPPRACGAAFALAHGCGRWVQTPRTISSRRAAVARAECPICTVLALKVPWEILGEACTTRATGCRTRLHHSSGLCQVLYLVVLLICILFYSTLRLLRCAWALRCMPTLIVSRVAARARGGERPR